MVKWHFLASRLRAAGKRPITVRSHAKEDESVDPGPVFRGWIAYDPGTCVGCMLCMKTCPAGAIAPEPGKKIGISLERCIFCGQCVDICAKRSIRFTRETRLHVTRKEDLHVK